MNKRGLFASAAVFATLSTAVPVEAAPVRATTLKDALGVFVNNRDIAAWEAWHGDTMKFRLLFTTWRKSTSWTNTKNTVQEQITNALSRSGGTARTHVLSLPLVLEGSGGLEAKRPVDADFWRWLGSYLAGKGLLSSFADGRPKIILRVGWEHNGEWFPWSSVGHEAAFVTAWRNMHDNVTAGAGGKAAVFSWGLIGNDRSSASSADAAWPGGEYVDIIEMDMYDDWRTKAQRIASKFDQKYLIAKSQSTGKPIIITEWGVRGKDEPWYVDYMHEFITQQIAARRLIAAMYFEAPTHALMPGTLFPKSAQRYKELFT